MLEILILTTNNSCVGWATRFTVAHQILQKCNSGQQKDIAHPTPTKQKNT